MPDAIGVASIEIVPNTVAFLPQAQAQVSTALAKVKSNITIEANIVSPTTSATFKQIGGQAAANATGFAALEQATIAAKNAAKDSTTTYAAQKAALTGVAVGTKEQEAALADLRKANVEYAAVVKRQIALDDEDAIAKLEEARATEAAAAAGKALSTVTKDTTKAMAGEIETAVGVTAALDRVAAANAAAAEATFTNRVASSDFSKSIGSQTLALTGFSGELTAVAVAGFVLFQSLQQRSAFEDNMHTIQVATHATRKEMEDTEKVAFDLSRALDVPGASASEAADAMAELTHKGFDLIQSQQLAKTVLLESAAAAEDVGTAVGQVTNLVLGYHIAIKDATEATDALTTAEVAGVGSTDEVAQSLSDLATGATHLGLGIRDVSTFLIELGNDGISAGDATAQLQADFNALNKDSKATEKGLAAIHVRMTDLVDATGKLKPDAFVIIGKALELFKKRQEEAGVSAAKTAVEERKLITAIFGFRGARGAMDLIGQGSEGFVVASERAHEFGATQEEAKKQAAGLGGQVRELQDNVSDLGVVIGQITEPAALIFIKTLNILTKAIEDEVIAIDDAVKKGLAFVGVLGQMADAVKKPFVITIKFVEGAGTSVHDFLNKIPGEKEGENLGAKTAHGFVKGFGILEAASSPIGALEHEIVKELANTRDKSDSETKGLEEETKKNLDRLADDWRDTGDAIAARQDELVKHTQDAARELTKAEQLLVLQAEQAPLQVQLAQAQAEEAAARRHLRREKRLGTASAITNAAQAAIAAENAVSTIQGQIQSNADKAATQAKNAADKITAARLKHQAEVLRSISSEETRRQAAVTHAATTAQLSDDLKTENLLRDFYRRSIETIRKEIAAARKQGLDLGNLKDELQALRLSKASVKDAIAKLRQDAAKEARDTRLEAAQLDEQILEARFGSDPTGAQTNKLVQAHERIIARLKEEQKHTRARSIEYKRLQLEIEQERAAIRDLRKAQHDKNGDAANFAALSFQFLTQQQGTLSNFGPNFFPEGALTVGGSSNLGNRIQPSGATRLPRDPRTTTSQSAAARGAGITFGQASDLVHSMHVLVREIQLLRKGAGHPRNRHTQAHNQALEDHH